MNVGDYVEIVDNTSGHGYMVGTIVQIVGFDGASFRTKDERGRTYFVNFQDTVPYNTNITVPTVCCGKDMDELPVEADITYAVPKYECLVCGSIYLTNGRKVSNELSTPLPSVNDMIDMPQPEANMDAVRTSRPASFVRSIPTWIPNPCAEVAPPVSFAAELASAIFFDEATSVR